MISRQVYVMYILVPRCANIICATDVMIRNLMTHYGQTVN